MLHSIIQKCATVHSNKVMERDARYQDKIRVRVEQDEVRDDLFFSRESIVKLTRLIKSTEKQLHKVREKCRPVILPPVKVIKGA